MPRVVYKDAKEDAEELHDAMKGFGTDEKALIEIICDRHPYQLEQIKDAFEEEFEKPLIKKIKSETRGDLEKFLVGLLQTRKDYLAETLKDAVDGLGTDERALIDVLVSCTAEDLEDIRETDVYKSVLDDVGGDFKKVIKSLFEADRDEADRVPDLARACKDAKRFYRAGEGRMGTNDRKLIQLMTKRSNAHLHLVDRIYQKVYEKSLDKVIKSETRGSYEDALLALLKPFDVYWAERAHKAMDGLGTDDDALIRCLLLCGKRKIPYVAAKYEELYEKSLEDAISSETSGDYKKAMLQFIKPAKKGALGNPLKAFQEISLDDIDEDGDMAEVGEGPIPDQTYFLMCGEHEYAEKFTFKLKEGTENTFFLESADGKFFHSNPPTLKLCENQLIWEEFTFEPHPEDTSKYAIRTYHGTYVSCSPDGEWDSGFQGTPGENQQIDLRDDLFS